MRTLCLNLQNFHTQSPEPSPLGTPQWIEPSCAEIFVSISPRVQFRDPYFVFIDIESTAGILGGEDRTLTETLRLARSIGPGEITAAIADRPAVAQVLAAHAPGTISPMGEDAKTLGEFSLSVLLDLEGLHPWSRPRLVEHVISFFQSIGIRSVREIFGYPQSTFRERWGELGVFLWKRLHGMDEQVISPLIPSDPFATYGFFDHPVTMSEQLMNYMRPSIGFLFLRLHGLGRFAQRLELTLHCEYSNLRHSIKIEPVSPSRDQRLFEDLLFQKLDGMDLLNPIREYEIQIYDVVEKIHQLDFFELRDTSEDHWQRLISFAKQADIEMGFLEPLPKHFPEESFHLKADWPEVLSPKDHVERMNEAIQVKSIYAKNLMSSPRPTLLLKHPIKLNKGKLRSYRKITFFPTERIQSSWWMKLKKAAGSEDLGYYRDYYFALSPDGELVWIYQDRESREYFLHGYFD